MLFNDDNQSLSLQCLFFYFEMRLCKTSTSDFQQSRNDAGISATLVAWIFTVLASACNTLPVTITYVPARQLKKIDEKVTVPAELCQDRT